MKNKAAVKKLINNNLYMTISVASKSSNPWIANIYYACDKNDNFYWYSPIDSKHSRLIRENKNIAISIFDSTAVGEDIDAVYISAEAKEVMRKKELLKGLGVYGKKMLRTGLIKTKAQMKKFAKQYRDFRGVSKLRLYKATPKKCWRLAPTELYKDKFLDSRVEVVL